MSTDRDNWGSSMNLSFFNHKINVDQCRSQTKLLTEWAPLLHTIYGVFGFVLFVNPNPRVVCVRQKRKKEIKKKTRVLDPSVYLAINGIRCACVLCTYTICNIFKSNNIAENGSGSRTHLVLVCLQMYMSIQWYVLYLANNISHRCCTKSDNAQPFNPVMLLCSGSNLLFECICVTQREPIHKKTEKPDYIPKTEWICVFHWNLNVCASVILCFFWWWVPNGSAFYIKQIAFSVLRQPSHWMHTHDD